MPRSPYRHSERSPARQEDDARTPSRDRRGELDRNRKSRDSHYIDRPSGSKSQSECNRERKSSGSSTKKMDFKTPSQKRKPEDDYKIPKRPRKLRFGNDTDEEKDNKKVDEIEDLENQLKELKSDARKKDLELAKLRKKATLKEKTIQKTEDLEGRNRKIWRENASLKTEIADLKIELESCQSKLRRSGESNTNISKKTSDDLTRLRKERDSTKKELNDAKEDLKATKDSLKLARDETKLLAKERDHAKNASKEFGDTLDRVRGEREQLKKTRRVTEDLENELSQMRICKEEAENNLQSRAREWFRKEKELQEKLASLEIDDEDLKVRKLDKIASSDEEENPNSTYCIVPEESQTVSSDEENAPDTQDLLESEEFILPSDEEFPDDTKEIKNYEIRNYKNPKSCLATGMKIPAKYLSKEFKPSVTTLNNRVIFVSAGSLKTTHNDEYKSGCGLSPACNIKWSVGTSISRVYIFGCVSHPYNNKEVWCCSHHNDASRDGVQLQTQHIAMKHRAGGHHKLGSDTEVTKSPIIGGSDRAKVDGVVAMDKEELTKDVKKASSKDVKNATSKPSLRRPKKVGNVSSSIKKVPAGSASSSSPSGEK